MADEEKTEANVTATETSAVERLAEAQAQIESLSKRIEELERSVAETGAAASRWGCFGRDVAGILEMPEIELEALTEETAPAALLQRLKRALAAASRGELGDTQVRRVEAELLAIGWPMDRSAKQWRLEAPAEVATERNVRGAATVTVEIAGAGLVKLSGLEVLVAPIRNRLRLAGFKTHG